MSAPSHPEDCGIEVDGDRAEPDEVDTLVVLRLAQSYFSAVSDIAEHVLGCPVSFAGVRVTNKCTLISATPSDLAAARRASELAPRYVSRELPTPREVSQSIAKLRTGVSLVPEGQHVSVHPCGPRVALVAARSKEDLSPWSRTTLRAQPTHVGGTKLAGVLRPRVALAARSEPAPFILDASEEMALQLGGLLWREVDIEVRIARRNGAIDQGTITKVHPLADDPDGELWRNWFAPHVPAWDALDDADAKLKPRTR